MEENSLLDIDTYTFQSGEKLSDIGSERYKGFLTAFDSDVFAEKSYASEKEFNELEKKFDSLSEAFKKLPSLNALSKEENNNFKTLMMSFDSYSRFIAQNHTKPNLAEIIKSNRGKKSSEQESVFSKDIENYPLGYEQWLQEVFGSHKNKDVNPEGAEQKKEFKKELLRVGDILQYGDSLLVKNSEAGEISVEKGNVGKSGNGLSHIIEQRFEKDNRDIDEISAIIPLVVMSAEEGKITRDVKVFQNEKDIGTLDIEKNGIIAFVSKSRDGKDEKFVITGFDDSKNKKQAEDAMKAVIAEHSSTPEFVIVKNQVVATLASSYKLHLKELKVNKERLANSKQENNKKKFRKEIEKLEKNIAKYEASEDINKFIADENFSKNGQGVFGSHKNKDVNPKEAEQKKSPLEVIKNIIESQKAVKTYHTDYKGYYNFVSDRGYERSIDGLTFDEVIEESQKYGGISKNADTLEATNEAFAALKWDCQNKEKLIFGIRGDGTTYPNNDFQREVNNVLDGIKKSNELSNLQKLSEIDNILQYIETSGVGLQGSELKFEPQAVPVNWPWKLPDKIKEIYASKKYQNLPLRDPKTWNTINRNDYLQKLKIEQEKQESENLETPEDTTISEKSTEIDPDATVSDENAQKIAPEYGFTFLDDETAEKLEPETIDAADVLDLSEPVFEETSVDLAEVAEAQEKTEATEKENKGVNSAASRKAHNLETQRYVAERDKLRAKEDIENAKYLENLKKEIEQLKKENVSLSLKVEELEKQNAKLMKEAKLTDERSEDEKATAEKNQNERNEKKSAGLTVNSVAELSNRLRTLQKENDELKKGNSSLKKENEQIKKANKWYKDAMYKNAKVDVNGVVRECKNGLVAGFKNAVSTLDKVRKDNIHLAVENKALKAMSAENYQAETIVER